MDRIRNTTAITWVIVTIALLILIGLALFASRVYFTNSEVNALTEGCYEIGGMPVIEKTWTQVNHFHCNTE